MESRLMRTVTIEVRGLLSVLSARGVEKQLAKLPGVHKAEVNYIADSLFMLCSAIFLLSSMGISILVATVTETMQQALLVSFLVLFPLLFLSGTIVPLENMPVALQYLAQASPLRHYMDVVLGLFLKGVGIDVLWPQLTAMFAISVVPARVMWREP